MILLLLAGAACQSGELASGGDAGTAGNGGPEPQGDAGSTTVVASGTTFPNAGGSASVVSSSGSIDTTGPFFQDLGSNGRACVSCHVAEDGWTITPSHLQARFDSTQGTDPVFRPNDGAVCPDADVSTELARRSAYALLLQRALIRVQLSIPAGAEFELIDHAGTYCNTTSSTALSMFRRPLPTTNLKFLSTVMWDGRETFDGESIRFDLEDQANGATLGHAAGTTALPQATRAQIVDFELGLFSAQSVGTSAQALDASGAQGGPLALASFPFSIGINDIPHSETAFTLFDPWTGLGGSAVDEARAQIARGQDIFNHRTFRLVGVNGVTDGLEVKCSNCHETPNVGTHSAGRYFDLGLADPRLAGPELPVYTLRNLTTGAVVQTTDPGRGLITGKWNDVAAFKVANLRNVAARGPYFHNGMARSLDDVVDFYDRRFRIGLDPGEHADLVAFLGSL